MPQCAHQKAVAAFLTQHAFEIPDGPTVPPLDVAERDVEIIALALSDLATSMGLEGSVTFTRSLFPYPRGMVEIRERLTMLRAAVALACVELGVPDSHIKPDPTTAVLFADLFIRGRRRASQVT